MSGNKFDKEKADYTLVCKAFIEGVAWAMTYGAQKYGRNNYMGGMQHSRLLAACLRHLFAHLDGETRDPESGLYHVDHAAANINMLKNYMAHGIGEDDRYIINVPAKQEDTVAQIEEEESNFYGGGTLQFGSPLTQKKANSND